MKKTKIVCTMGPAVDNLEVLSSLLKEGMNVARLNFSHGSHEEHGGRIEKIREASKLTNMPVAILLDTKGPEIRTKKLTDGKDVILKKGQTFFFTTDDIVGDSNGVSVTYMNFARDLSIGNTILVDDGLLRFKVEKIEGSKVITVLLNDGALGEKKGVNLPNVNINLPALAENDIEDLKFGCRMGVDFVAASFIRKASDVEEVRKVLQTNGGENIKIISKIENQEGLDNFEEILVASDGIMVARGDLGVEIPMEKVPMAQKYMIELCNEVGKPVITATQMLDSMIKNPTPTRAEVNDVANAILDGTDAIMLSGETAKGAFPLEAVKVMNSIALEIDPYVQPMHPEFDETELTESVARGTVEVSASCSSKVIAIGTHTGRSALSIRKYFPKAPILAVVDNEQVARQLLLVRGVHSIVNSKISDHEDIALVSLESAKKLFNLKTGDKIVVSYGQKIFISGTTNSLRVLCIE
ncbi:MAG: pyruvate kinase [Brevinemataceae bacterium]